MPVMHSFTAAVSGVVTPGGGTTWTPTSDPTQCRGDGQSDAGASSSISGGGSPNMTGIPLDAYDFTSIVLHLSVFMSGTGSVTDGVVTAPGGGSWAPTPSGFGNHSATGSVVGTLSRAAFAALTDIGWVWNFTNEGDPGYLNSISVTTLSITGTYLTPDVLPAPTQLSITPSSGTAAGGTPVTITGANFVATPTVKIGGTACTSVVFVNSTTLTCVTPAHVGGAFNVVVTNPDAQVCTLPLSYTFIPGPDPEQYSVHLDFGPTAGGNTVTIIGRYFVATPTITFDGTPATSVVWVNSSHLTCKPPAHAAGSVNIVVTNPDGGICTLPLSYEYSDMPPPPPIQLLVRNTLGTSSGTTKGGTLVTIGGSLFQPGCTVTFGGVAATAVVWISSAEIRCVTPAHAAGAATIVVTNPDGGVCVTPLSFLYVTPRDVIVILTSSPPWQTLGQWALHRLDLTPTTQGPAGSAGEDS